ncbi:MAG: hypothetical protein P4L50_01235 [Anaerolineaceae bacterium]|nr:hypothetical protein [Anaerolineaceae bacterium]
MQITSLPLYNNLPSNTTSAIVSDPACSEALAIADMPTAIVEQSSLAALSAKSGWSEVSANADGTVFSYRSDGSLALQAETSVNLSMRSQDTQIELTLSADNFKPNSFSPDAFKNGPIQLEIKYWNDTQQIETTTHIQQVNTLRSVGDILQDINSALNDVLNRDGDKNVYLELDEEAVRTLLSDPKVKGLMKELTGMICVLNSLSLKGGPRDSYTIKVSGKGKPYLNINQTTAIQAESDHIDVKLTILPPKSAQTAAAAQTTNEQTDTNP